MTYFYTYIYTQIISIILVYVKTVSGFLDPAGVIDYIVATSFLAEKLGWEEFNWICFSELR